MSYEPIRETFPVARKPYQCIWCGQGIPVGMKHRHEVSTYDGAFQNHRWHLECERDAAKCFSDGDCEFTPYSNERPQVPLLDISESHK